MTGSAATHSNQSEKVTRVVKSKRLLESFMCNMLPHLKN